MHWHRPLTHARLADLGMLPKLREHFPVTCCQPAQSRMSNGKQVSPSESPQSSNANATVCAGSGMAQVPKRRVADWATENSANDGPSHLCRGSGFSLHGKRSHLAERTHTKSIAPPSSTAPSMMRSTRMRSLGATCGADEPLLGDHMSLRA